MNPLPPSFTGNANSTPAVVRRHWLKPFVRAAALVLLASFAASNTFGAPTPYAMSLGNKTWDFADIANWVNDFASGIDATNWGSVAVNATGTVGDGIKISTSTATFTTVLPGVFKKALETSTCFQQARPIHVPLSCF